MATPLILSLLSKFDPKGFEDLRSSIQGMTSQVRTAQSGVVNLSDSFRELLRVAGSIGIATGLAQFVRQAAEAEQAGVLLQGQLERLGVASTGLGREFENLAQSQAQTTRFSSTESLQALNRLITLTNSTANATQLLVLAQDIAAATGRDLSTVTLALARAQEGSVFLLSRLTGLNTSLATELARNGTLVQELQKRFGGFAEREGQSFNGQLAVTRNRLEDVAQTIGQSVLPALTGFLRIINSIPQEALVFGGFVGAIVGLGVAVQTLTPLVVRLALSLTGIGVAGAAASTGLRAVAISSGEAAVGITATQVAAARAALGLEAAGARAGTLAVIFKGLALPVLALAAAATLAVDSQNKLKESQDRLNAALQSGTLVSNAIKIANGQFVAGLEEAGSRASTVAAAIEELSNRFKNLGEASQNGIIGAQIVKDISTLRQLQTELSKVDEALRKLGLQSSDEIDRQFRQAILGRSEFERQEFERNADLALRLGARNADEQTRLETVLNRTRLQLLTKQFSEERSAQLSAQKAQVDLEAIQSEQQLRDARLVGDRLGQTRIDIETKLAEERIRLAVQELEKERVAILANDELTVAQRQNLVLQKERETQSQILQIRQAATQVDTNKLLQFLTLSEEDQQNVVKQFIDIRNKINQSGIKEALEEFGKEKIEAALQISPALEANISSTFDKLPRTLKEKLAALGIAIVPDLSRSVSEGLQNSLESIDTRTTNKAAIIDAISAQIKPTVDVNLSVDAASLEEEIRNKVKTEINRINEELKRRRGAQAREGAPR